jgi:hypothetical protein
MKPPVSQNREEFLFEALADLKAADQFSLRQEAAHRDAALFVSFHS